MNDFNQWHFNQYLAQFQLAISEYPYMGTTVPAPIISAIAIQKFILPLKYPIKTHKKSVLAWKLRKQLMAWVRYFIVVEKSTIWKALFPSRRNSRIMAAGDAKSTLSLEMNSQMRVHHAGRGGCTVNIQPAKKLQEQPQSIAGCCENSHFFQTWSLQILD